MHETLGFTYCGQQRYVGYKHGRWLDLNTYQIVYEEKL
jgi:L-amino acid N-acyltransferase YncA